MLASTLQIIPNSRFSPVKKYKAIQDKDPRKTKNFIKFNLFPEASAIPDSKGASKAITRKENEMEYEYKTVLITSHPKKDTVSEPSTP